MTPQIMWEREFYQLRPHQPSSSMSADHTNLVAKLCHPHQNFTKLFFLFLKRTQGEHSSTPAVSQPLCHTVTLLKSGV